MNMDVTFGGNGLAASSSAEDLDLIGTNDTVITGRPPRSPDENLDDTVIAHRPWLTTNLEELDDYFITRVNVPASIPALSLLCVSDTYGKHDQWMPNELPKADILVHAGNFSSMGARQELVSFASWADSLLQNGIVKDIVFISGTHDVSMALNATRPRILAAQEKVKHELISHSNFFHYLEDAGCEVQGLRFWGSPWTVRQSGERHDLAFQLECDDLEVKLADIYSGIPERVDILITHQTPYGQGTDMDRLSSHALLERVLRVRPLVNVFGQTHSDHCVSVYEGCHTVFINPWICGNNMRSMRKPVLVVLQPRDEVRKTRRAPEEERRVLR